MTFPYRCLGRYRVLYIEPNNRIWASSGYAVYFSDDLGQTFHLRATYLAPVLYAAAATWRLPGRVLRTGILGALPLADGSLLAGLHGKLLRCAVDDDRLLPVLERRGRTMKMELSPDGLVYAGEYFYNDSREPVHIYMSRDHGKTWDVVHTFPARAIRHVHAITYDPIRRGLLVLTGDLDHESKVLFATDGFSRLEVLAHGSQSARAVGVVPVAGGFYLPTDTPYEQNYVQFLSNDGRLQPRCPVAGSCLAACPVNQWAFFGTAVEPSPVNHDPCAVLYGTPDGVEWHVIARWHVDSWSRSNRLQAALFQMARVILPAGENRTGFLFATSVAVQGGDGILHRWQVG